MADEQRTVDVPPPPPVEDAGVGAPDTSPTQSSKVIPLARSNIFLYLTIIFVGVNIILPRYVALGCHGLLVILLVLLLICYRKPENFPDWFQTLQKNFTARLAENPPEISVIFGIVLLSIVNNVFLAGEEFEIVPRSRELLSVALVVGAFLLNRRKRKYNFGKRSVWDLFRKDSMSRVKVRKNVVEEPEEDQRPVSSESQVLKADQNRKRWEQRQKQRWEEWIMEEVERLNDDKK